LDTMGLFRLLLHSIQFKRKYCDPPLGLTVVAG
jgi:hypothetical protein